MRAACLSVASHQVQPLSEVWVCAVGFTYSASKSLRGIVQGIGSQWYGAEAGYRPKTGPWALDG